MSVLVYVEHAEGNFKKSALEIVSYSKAIADQLKTNLIALAIGNVSDENLTALGKYGAEKVLNVSDKKLDNFVNEAYSFVIADTAKQEAANVIVLSNTFSGKGLAPRLAVKLKADFVSGAVELPDIQNEKFVVKKTTFSGKAFAYVELLSSIKLITLTINSYQLIESAVSSKIVKISPEFRDSDFRATVKQVVRSNDKTPLPEAELVVSGGRGLKGPENWHLIEDLADALGAATACSKPVSDADWRPHEEHVGQTGISISPNLYIAIGISGAIQHLAGVSSSKTIVVINKDPEAPFFKAADYGIVGDAFEVVPNLIESIKEFKAQK
jgi:electron transfer flavoprotein alpha subunit